MERRHPQLSVARQCQLLQVNRAWVYRQPKPPRPEDLAVMALLDRQHLETHFYGSRRLAAWLRGQGRPVSRKRVQRLRRLMGQETVYRRPNTSKPAPGQRVYPCLLRGVKVERANQAWAAAITYIPLAWGFLCLAAILDWRSRKALAWRLSSALDAEFCVAALEEALKGGQPEIFNTDQGRQFTSDAFTSALTGRGIRVSLEGKGRCLDNVLVERLWRSVKYEEVYLRAYESVAEAKRGIDANKATWMG